MDTKDMTAKQMLQMKLVEDGDGGRLARLPSAVKQAGMHLYFLDCDLQLITVLVYVFLAALAFGVLYSIFGAKALPRAGHCFTNETQLNSSLTAQCSQQGTIFGVYLVVTLALALGALGEKVYLPPLFGQVVAGILLRNAPYHLNVGATIDMGSAGILKKLAFVSLLLKAGISMDVNALKKSKCKSTTASHLTPTVSCARIAIIPIVFETITVMLMSHAIFDFPWTVGVLLGFVLGPVAPAIVAPMMVDLQNRQLGVTKGIPTIMIAACSIAIVLCVAAHSTVLSLVSAKGSLAWIILKAPTEIVIGVVYGIAGGVFLWFIPLDRKVA